jgi:hypothetical protein
MVTKEQDRYEWMRETAQHLRADELAALDPVAMADWFDEVSNSDRREVVSRLRCIIEHRLKLDYVTGPDLERNRRGWDVTIGEQTGQLESIFAESPSLRGHLTPELLAKTYASVRSNVATAYEVEPPTECPYRYAHLLWEEK